MKMELTPFETFDDEKAGFVAKHGTGITSVGSSPFFNERRALRLLRIAHRDTEFFSAGKMRDIGFGVPRSGKFEAPAFESWIAHGRGEGRDALEGVEVHMALGVGSEIDHQRGFEVLVPE